MKLLSLFAAAALAAAATPAFAQSVDYARSTITFVSKQMNVPVDGRFRKFSAQIDFDPKQLAKAKAEIEVDLASIDTGSAEADAEVGKRAWLNTAAFPAAKFVSSAVKQTGPDRYEVQGRLSIKGISRDISAPFTAKTANGTTTYEGAFTLPRLQFKIGEGAWSDTDTVADEVQVRFRIVTAGRK